MNVATINLKLFLPQTIHFSRFTPIFPGFLIKFQYFSRTGKTFVIFPGAVGILCISFFMHHFCLSKEYGLTSGMGQHIYAILVPCTQILLNLYTRVSSNEKGPKIGNQSPKIGKIGIFSDVLVKLR